MLNGLKQIFKSVVSASLVPVCLVATLTIGAQADAKGIVETNFSAAPTDDNTSAVKAFASEMDKLPDPIIVDFSTETSFSANAKVFTDKNKPDIGGKYSFVTVNGVNCMQLNHESAQSDSNIYPYRIMFGFNAKDKLTADYKWMRVTYMTTDISGASLQMYCNSPNTASKIIEKDTSNSAGLFVRTEAVDISVGVSGKSILTRYIGGQHNTLQLMSTTENVSVYIKEVAFFTNEQQAYYHYGDAFAMTFGDNGSASLETGTNYGNAAITNEALDITYADTVQSDEFKYHYMAKLKLNNPSLLPSAYRYVRVLYSAKNPEGCTGASLFVKGDGINESPEYKLQADIRDTDREYVLSDTVYLPDTFLTRLIKTSGGRHLSFCVNAAESGGEYSIKAVYFFPTEEAAVSASGDIIKADFEAVPTDDNTSALTAFKDEMRALAAPVVVDFSTEETFSENAKVFTDKSKPGIGGQYSFVTVKGVDCMKLGYESTQSDSNIYPYRIMFQFKEANKLTADHKWMRVTYMTTDNSGVSLQMYCNSPKDASKILVNDTSDNAGIFTRTEAIDISMASGNSILTRFIKPQHNTLQFMTNSKNKSIYIKEVAFFTDIKQAYSHYGEPVVMTFGEDGTGAIETGTNYGNAVINNDTDAVDISYSKAVQTDVYKYHYMAKLRFGNPAMLPSSYRYVRVLYSAKNPEGCTEASLFVKGDGCGNGEYELQGNLADTNGEYVLSGTTYLPQNFLNRISKTSGARHVSFCVNTAHSGGEYSIKAIYFFPTQADADEFALYVEPEISESEEKELPNSGILMMLLLKKKTENGDADGKDTQEINRYENVAKPVIVDFSSEDSYGVVAKTFTDQNKPYIGGKYSFVTVDSTNCIKLDYEPVESTNKISAYRIMFMFNAKNKLTADHKWMRVTYMTTNGSKNELSLYCNYPDGTIVLDKATSKNEGEWVCTVPVDISRTFANDKGVLTRYIGGQHNTLQFMSTSENTEIFIKEVVFFADKNQALDYTGEHYWEGRTEYLAMTFGNNGNGAIQTGTNYGNYAINNKTGTLDITYSGTVDFHGYRYLAKPRFADANVLPDTHVYMRVLYSADHPEGIDNTTMYIINDANSQKDNLMVSENIVDTDGEFVLSETVKLTESIVKRFANNGARHCSVCFGAETSGGKYSIKAIYFFLSVNDAEGFGK